MLYAGLPKDREPGRPGAIAFRNQIDRDGLTLSVKLAGIVPEINTLPPKPRRIGHWVWMIMMVAALLVAIGRAVFG